MHGFCPAPRRPLLSLYVSRASSTRNGPQLRRGRRAWSTARNDRRDAGDRSSETDPWDRRTTHWATGQRRHIENAVSRIQGAQGPELSNLRRFPYYSRIDRLRTVLRLAPG